MNARPEQQRQVADTLSRILARKHPGTSWTVRTAAAIPLREPSCSSSLAQISSTRSASGV